MSPSKSWIRKAARDKAYREAHKEELKAKRKIYYEANREKLKARQREWHRNNRCTKRLRRHGLTAEAYESMLEAQGGKCAICKTTNWGHNGPNIDHNHTTKQVRGILCYSCNTALGGVKDNLRTAQALVNYLKRNKNMPPRGDRGILFKDNNDDI